MEEEEDFVMVPWYRRSTRRAPQSNTQLEDGTKFDELLEYPTERVGARMEEFCTRWEEELNQFHSNVANFITNLEEVRSSKVQLKSDLV